MEQRKVNKKATIADLTRLGMVDASKGNAGGSHSYNSDIYLYVSAAKSKNGKAGSQVYISFASSVFQIAFGDDSKVAPILDPRTNRVYFVEDNARGYSFGASNSTRMSAYSTSLADAMKKYGLTKTTDSETLFFDEKLGAYYTEVE